MFLFSKARCYNKQVNYLRCVDDLVTVITENALVLAQN
jgi:hypothetical protein